MIDRCIHSTRADASPATCTMCSEAAFGKFVERTPTVEPGTIEPMPIDEKASERARRGAETNRRRQRKTPEQIREARSRAARERWARTTSPSTSSTAQTRTVAETPACETACSATVSTTEDANA